MEMTLQLFSWSYNIHRLGVSDIALLKQKAEQGDPQYSYMYGRYHYCVRPEPDSVAQAYNLYKIALEGGVVDAKVALAIMWYAGDMGMVNVEKGSELLFEAIDGDSSFACQKYLLDMIVGLNGMLPNPEQAANLLEEIIISDDSPMWLYLMGRAVMANQGMEPAVKWFKQAADAGFVEANCFLVLASCHNDNWELKVDSNDYLNQLNGAVKLGDGLAAYMLAGELAQRYDEVLPELRAEYREQLFYTIMVAIRGGYGEGAVLLGDLYMNGDCDTEQSSDEAWKWYSKGALLGCPEAFERLYDMATSGEHPEEESFCDQLAIEGARLGSESLLAQTIEIYKNGGLDMYAEEIQKYYL